MDKGCYMSRKINFFPSGNNPSFLMRINLLLSHSSLPLLRALPVVLGNRYFENSMISGTSHERTHLHAKRSIYNTAFQVSIELTIRQS